MTNQPTNTFFCGTQYGIVTKAKATNWQEFVNRYLAAPITLKYTRDEYEQLPERERKKAKKTDFFTSAVFRTSPSPRLLPHAVGCSLISLDIDDAESARALLENLDEIQAKLQPLNFAIYHTASSTINHPRIRIVVEASNLPVNLYSQATWTLQTRLGLPRVDPVSEKFVQPMYRPSRWRGSDTQPLILAETGGEPFTVDMISPDARRAAPAPSTPTPSGTPRDPEDENLDVLGFIRQPTDNVTLPMVRDLLDSLDPDMEYLDWVRVAAGLRHQFRDDPALMEEAFEAFNTWSARGRKYTTPEDTRAKWDSFRPQPTDRNPTTFRSLLHMAKAAGYDDTPLVQAQEAASVETLSHLQENAESARELVDVTLRYLVRHPRKNISTEVLELDALSKALQRRFDTRVTTATLRRDLRERREAQARQERAARDADPDSDQAPVMTPPPWLEPFVFVSSTGQFLDTRNFTTFSPTSFNIAFARNLPRGEDDQRPPTPVEFASTQAPIPVVADTRYFPAQPDALLVEHSGGIYVNTYRRSYAPANIDTSQYEGALFRKHLQYLVAEEEHQLTILDICAHLVQHPDKKINFSMFLQGGQGNGKTQFATALNMVLGKTNCRTVSESELFSRYNAFAADTQLVVLEEIRVPGHNRNDVMTILLPLITNTQITINQKFRDARNVENNAFYLTLSNHKDALIVPKDDRRYFILESPLQTREQVDAIRATGHYSEMDRMLRADTGGLRHFLENYPIRPSFRFNGPAPRTIYFEHTLQATSNEYIYEFRELLEDGDHPLIQPDLVSVQHMTDAINARLHGRKMSSRYAVVVLQDEGYEKCGRCRVDGQRETLWVKNGTLNACDWKEVASERVTKFKQTEAGTHFLNNEEPPAPELSSPPPAHPATTTKTLQEEIDELL